MTGYDYMVMAAEHSKYNANHWFRYLSKVIYEDSIYIDDDTFNKLYKSNKLTKYQKVTLKLAIKKGSSVNECVISLNKPAKLKNLQEYFKRKDSIIERGTI
ncbi:hypothetical protein LV469_01305 [Peptoniphilus sp. GNH]|nr:hypothetical protein LV469_01305 [Peptoniphilus sp. GNH]